MSTLRHESYANLDLAQRNLYPGENATREELLARVLANMRTPPRA